MRQEFAACPLQHLRRRSARAWAKYPLGFRRLRRVLALHGNQLAVANRPSGAKMTRQSSAEHYLITGLCASNAAHTWFARCFQTLRMRRMRRMRLVRGMRRMRPLAVIAALACTAWAIAASGAPRRQLRVCADGNNLPFSNVRRAGFENQVAELIAADLQADLAYTWAPQRRGFVRNTLEAGHCDVIMGVPSRLESLKTSRPYYRSSYVFVSGPTTPRVDSLNAAELRDLRIGVPLVGDDGANPPPVLALALRGLVDNVRGYLVHGDYTRDSPAAELIRALRRHEIDLAIAWGPLAGYYAAHGQPRLRLTALRQAEAPPGLDFAFDISLGVRKADVDLLADLNGALERQQAKIAAVLARYSVPVYPR
jgi:mxaJ protein